MKNRRNTIAAVCGAVLLAVATGTAAHGGAVNNPVNTAGDSHASTNATAVVNASTTASHSTISRSGYQGIRRNSRHTTTGGNSGAHSSGSAKTGSQTFIIK